MKPFVTGARGYIGKALVKAGFQPLEANVCDYEDVERVIQNAKPDLIVEVAVVLIGFAYLANRKGVQSVS